MSQPKMIDTRVTDEKSVVRSSIPLQSLCHIHRPIVFLWFVAEILIFVWKGLVGWPLDWTIYGFEIFALCLTLTLEYIRLELIIYANLTENLFYIFIGFVVTLISIVTFLYWTIWQWLVLKLEFVLGCTQLVFCLFQLILVLTAVLSFCKKPTKQKTA
ncbi:unnamed protein product [Adineta steineri]|uniref:Transmembrane protein n=1 Tax=Adineta steineri TaxID=433720 RepID=A0A814WW00_9BILA|nr:unnamed protein product [Adineta steineri]CAF1155585.1 unnamed protein product [Adineta steineri]CAF1209553.1 unnamed protein product [Adineta steineri]CAF1279349.1 unnamed protein product [Adineta steineri]CAF1313148.1 unnamed protein product [Adineta steineri]